MSGKFKQIGDVANHIITRLERKLTESANHGTLAFRRQNPATGVTARMSRRSNRAPKARFFMVGRKRGTSGCAGILDTGLSTCERPATLLTGGRRAWHKSRSGLMAQNSPIESTSHAEKLSQHIRDQEWHISELEALINTVDIFICRAKEEDGIQFLFELIDELRKALKRMEQTTQHIHDEAYHATSAGGTS